MEKHPTFKKKQQKMEKHKKTDKTFFISLDSLKRRNFKNEELKEMARLKANIKVRIVKVKLKKWKNIKYYFTNIPKEIATP